MDISPFLIVLAAAIATFVLLLAFAERRNAVAPTGRATEIVAAGMVAINVSSVLGLAWFAAGMLAQDGAMIIELAICAGLIAVLVSVTACGVLLGRRGMSGAALAVLAVGAVPTLFVYGFLVYLDSNPIDWR